MRAIFGGTGDVGRIVVDKLLSTNDVVKVLSRNPTHPAEHSNVHFIIGNVLEISDVQRCLEVGDSVVITLGLKNSSEDTMSRGTKNIVSAMVDKKCTRLICLSARGAGDSWDDIPERLKGVIMNEPVLKASFKDHGVQEEIVKSSNLLWTIVRPTEIVPTPESGNFVVNGRGNNLSYQISKYDVAQFIVDELDRGKYLRQVATITS